MNYELLRFYHRRKYKPEIPFVISRYEKSQHMYIDSSYRRNDNLQISKFPNLQITP